MSTDNGDDSSIIERVYDESKVSGRIIGGTIKNKPL